MSLPASSLEQLFQIEANLEAGFVAALRAAGIANVASSRSGVTFAAPFVSLWVQNGPTAPGMQFAIAGLGGNLFPYTAFEGTLVTEIVTDRVADLETPQHLVLVGKVRKNLQAYRLVPLWNQYADIEQVYDIRENGTIDTWQDENQLDHTVISWDLRHNINPNAWPSDINS